MMTREQAGVFRRNEIKVLSARIAEQPTTSHLPNKGYLHAHRAGNYALEGQCDLALADYATAEKCFAMAEDLRPLPGGHLLIRAQIHLKTGEFEKAISDLDIAREKGIPPHACQALQSYAQFGLGDYQVAAGSVLLSCAACPRDAVTPEFVGKLSQCQSTGEDISAEDRRAIVLEILGDTWRLPPIPAETETPPAEVSDAGGTGEADDSARPDLPLCLPELSIKWRCSECDAENHGAFLHVDGKVLSGLKKEPVFIASHQGFPEDMKEYQAVPPIGVCAHCGAHVRFWSESPDAAV